MHAGSGECIAELRDVYELAPLLTYDGWESDVRQVEGMWARGSTSFIQEEVEEMRRKQSLHEGDRSDAALQVLDDVKQGLTYDGWEFDVRQVERMWTGGSDFIPEELEEMRRKQSLHEGGFSDAAGCCT